MEKIKNKKAIQNKLFYSIITLILFSCITLNTPKKPAEEEQFGRNIMYESLTSGVVYFVLFSEDSTGKEQKYLISNFDLHYEFFRELDIIKFNDTLYYILEENSGKYNIEKDSLFKLNQYKIDAKIYDKLKNMTPLEVFNKYYEYSEKSTHNLKYPNSFEISELRAAIAFLVLHKTIVFDWRGGEYSITREPGSKYFNDTMFIERFNIWD